MPEELCLSSEKLKNIFGFPDKHLGHHVERAYQALAGRPVAKSILFFGCRKPNEDFLYSTSDLKKWVDLGVVDVRPAFSRSEGDSLECKYVQESVLFLTVIMNDISHLHL